MTDVLTIEKEPLPASFGPRPVDPAKLDCRGDVDLEGLVRLILSRITPLSIHLFGSRARGDFHEDSDHDLYIVVDDDWPGEVTTSKAFDLIEDRKVAADAFMVTEAVFRRRRNMPSTLAYEVAHFGRPVYVR